MKNVKIVNNFVSDEDCQTMIDRLNYLNENDAVVRRPDGRIGVINKDDEVFAVFVDKYLNKAKETFNDEFVNYNGYIATIYNEGIGMDDHIDSDPGQEMGVLMYLNDNYYGGELTFIGEDDVKHVITPKKGDAVYCPSWYLHGVNKVISGTRYFFTVSLLK
jgi:hypothetical protein